MPPVTAHAADADADADVPGAPASALAVRPIAAGGSGPAVFRYLVAAGRHTRAACFSGGPLAGLALSASTFQTVMCMVARPAWLGVRRVHAWVVARPVPWATRSIRSDRSHVHSRRRGSEIRRARM
jgi:hypothetical protein